MPCFTASHSNGTWYLNGITSAAIASEIVDCLQSSNRASSAVPPSCLTTSRIVADIVFVFSE